MPGRRVWRAEHRRCFFQLEPRVTPWVERAGSRASRSSQSEWNTEGVRQTKPVFADEEGFGWPTPSGLQRISPTLTQGVTLGCNWKTPSVFSTNIITLLD